MQVATILFLLPFAKWLSFNCTSSRTHGSSHCLAKCLFIWCVESLAAKEPGGFQSLSKNSRPDCKHSLLQNSFALWVTVLSQILAPPRPQLMCWRRWFFIVLALLVLVLLVVNEVCFQPKKKKKKRTHFLQIYSLTTIQFFFLY